jgi:hypothetical protein
LRCIEGDESSLLNALTLNKQAHTFLTIPPPPAGASSAGEEAVEGRAKIKIKIKKNRAARDREAHE